jgi:Icc-related predicted phosphoesterase
MAKCIFVSDLHGKLERYRKLFQIIISDKPDAVFIGGDLLPHAWSADHDFIGGYLAKELRDVRNLLADAYPRIFVILGNDDGVRGENAVKAVAAAGLWEYAHNTRLTLDRWSVYGYAFVPPTPFRLKDWERYDVSRYVDPGCISPEEGIHSVPLSEDESRYSTIQNDLDRLAGKSALDDAVFLFHAPPYQTNIDRAGLDGKTVDHVPMDPHVGSIAIRRFIENRQPMITLHGHVHESARLTGSWRDRIGKTHSFTAAHDGPELAVIRIDLEDPDSAYREFI